METELPQGTETILLVESEEPLRLATTIILERLGYKVLQAATADQAVHLATLSNAHLLLVDLTRPEMSGPKLAQEVSILRPGIRVVYFSAESSQGAPDEGEDRSPGVGFVKKPFSTEALARTVREILDAPLPLHEEERPSSEGNESILIVDDDPQARRFMTRTLERLNYHVLEAQYPDRALSIARNSRVHLVVMDMVMPQMTGPELARAIADLKPKVRYLFVSETASEEASLEESPGGVEARFLRKPFTSNELGRAVRTLFDAPRPR